MARFKKTHNDVPPISIIFAVTTTSPHFHSRSTSSRAVVVVGTVVVDVVVVVVVLIGFPAFPYSSSSSGGMTNRASISPSPSSGCREARTDWLHLWSQLAASEPPFAAPESPFAAPEALLAAPEPTKAACLSRSLAWA